VELYFRYRTAGGFRRLLKIDAYPAITLDQARRSALKLRGQVAGGEWTRPRPEKPRRGALTVQEAAGSHCHAPLCTLCYRRSAMDDEPRADECVCPPEEQAPDLRPVEGELADDELATLTKALGHPARVKILRVLARRGRCVCGEIVDELPLAQSTVSQHLKVLRDAALIRGEVDGPRVCYCLSPRALRRLKALVAAL
jgi:ArsR family transcriptional regulator